MGHLRLGPLPRTQRWKQVIGLLEDGADLPDLADASFRAALTGIGRVPDDPGFLSTLNVIVGLASASRQQDIVNALKDSGQKVQEFRKTELLRLRKKLNAIQVRLDKAYEDRLDGIIDEAYWRDRSTKWRAEQNALSQQIDRMGIASRDFVDQALEILELSQMAYTLYVERGASEKRRLLQEVLSNCSMDGATLYPTYKKPFNFIAEGVSLQFKLPRLDLN